MKMTILKIGYKNIRKITDLTLSFTKEDGSIVKNSFIMMANGTGKTTTMDLLKGLLDGSAENWSEDKVCSFKPTTVDANRGEFSVTIRFDEKQYIYFLTLNYREGTTKIETASTSVNGREEGRHLPETINKLFTSDFVRRFVFDGEQVVKSTDSSSNEAEETIRYLYCLNKLEEINAYNQQVLEEIQDAEGGSKGTSSSLENLRTRKKKVDERIDELNKQRMCLKKKIKQLRKEKERKEKQRAEIDENYEDLNKEKHEIEQKQTQNRSDIDSQIQEIIGLIKSPYLINEEFCERMRDLGNSMQKLKLPKDISKDFFDELAHASNCICGRSIGEEEKKEILRNAESYLGHEEQGVLNLIKSALINRKYDMRLTEAFQQLHDLQNDANKLKTQHNSNEEALVQAGGEKARNLQAEIDELSEKIGKCDSDLSRIESKDETDRELTEHNNIHRAERQSKYYEQKIVSATNTNDALRKKKIIEELVLKIKEQATVELKKDIVCKANEKLKRVISDDNIRIKNIDGYIQLEDRSGASEGQTLGIAYCFLSTLFEDAELLFPFLIDSPTGKMDLDKRKAVADIIPDVFNQMIAFVQSAEVEQFADQFYENKNTQYLTIIASPQESDIEVHKGMEFFDAYQRKHKGDEINAF